MQDAEKTWELIRGQAGQGTVVRSSGFSVNDKSGSTYADTMNTTIEKEDRVELRDLQEQIEGEAISFFLGKLSVAICFTPILRLKRLQLVCRSSFS